MGSRKIKALSTIQRPFALNISKAYRTTATNAALVLTGLTPLHIRAKLEAIYERVIRLKENAALGTTVFSTLQYETPGSTQHVNPAHKNSGIHVKIARRSTPRIEDVPVASQFYTDGSKHDNGVSCAYAYYEHGTLHSQWKSHLAAHNSIFQAEALTIEAAIQYAHDIQLARTEICTDSMSVLHHTSPIILQIQQTLHSNQQSNIKLKWVRGHSGIAGNEMADQLANEAATNNNAQAVSALIPASFLKRQLRDIGNKQWQHEWENGDTGRRTFEFYPVVDKERLQAIPPLMDKYVTGLKRKLNEAEAEGKRKDDENIGNTSSQNSKSKYRKYDPMYLFTYKVLDGFVNNPVITGHFLWVQNIKTIFYLSGGDEISYAATISSN
ncbi:uncharacterized protein LOC118189413 [Stegodyphus dumicola]|uniref:uncharacterized protein LOC118189413 n=1 Tax=Stegodyphus dumicola TaxID=202533 RepID=UPI0015B35856|nr:uncharacterized protein LOC118189413 [Stegodyphus dumicola]